MHIPLDHNIKNAPCYVHIWILVYHKLKTKLKDELYLYLAKMNDVNPKEMKEEFNKWMSEVGRGSHFGL